MRKTFILGKKLTIVGLCLLFVSGCAQLSSSDNKEPAALISSQKAAEEAKAKSPQVVVPANMSGEAMYKIMLTEMLVKSQRGKDAFQVIYPLALETRDPILAERTFQVSMLTGSIASIEAATNLWLEVSPKKALPWKAAYLIDVRMGAVEAGFKKWQTYLSLTDEKLSVSLIDVGVRVPQTAPVKPGLSFLKKVQEAYPDAPESYFSLGTGAEAYRQYALAIPPLTESIRRYQDRLDVDMTPFSRRVEREAYLLLAAAYLKTARYQEGIDSLEDYSEAHPKDWELQEQIARLEVKSEQYALAEKRYQSIVDGNSKALTAKLSLGLLMLERKAFLSADKVFISLQKQPIYKETATYYLAVSAQEQGHYKKAVRLFSRISSDDYYLDAQLHIIEIKFPKLGLAKSLQALQALSPKTNTGKVKLYRAEAIFYKKSKQFTKAIESYDGALKLSPNNVSVLVSQADIFYKLKQFNKYENNLLKVLKINKDDVEALNALGYYYVENAQHLDQAAVLLHRADKLNPNSFYILDSLGWLAYQQGDYVKAEGLLERAFALQTDLEVFLHLVDTKVQLHKIKEARALIKKYQNTFQNDKRLERLLKQLKK